MKKLSLLLGVLMIAGASYACDGNKKACCKKEGAKKECCKKGSAKDCSKEASKETKDTKTTDNKKA